MKLTHYFIGVVAIVSLGLVGCSGDLAKTATETDEDVYEIIDKAWAEELGDKFNYQITGAFTDPNNILLKNVVPESNVLTLPQAIQIATENNRIYNTEKENLYLTALDYREIRHIYEPMPFLNGEAGYYEEGDDSSYGGAGTLGFTQLLSSGAQIGADVSLGWLGISSGDARGGFSSIVSAIVSQPLLRGSGRKIALENLTQGQRDTLYQIRSFNRFRKEFVTEIAVDYQRILELQKKSQDIDEYYTELSKLQDRLEKLSKFAKVSVHELEEAKQDKLKALSEKIAADKEYGEAIDDFKIKLSIRPDFELTLYANELLEYQQAPLPDFTISESEAIDLALNQRLDLANVADMLEDVARKVELAEDGLRAELNLVGYASLDPQSSDLQDRYQLALELDLPIDRLSEKNSYRKSLITLMQQQRNHIEAKNCVIGEVRNSYRDMKEAYQQYKIGQESLKVANDRTQHTLTLLQYKRASIRDVLDAQEDLLDAKVALTKATVDYFEASMNFLRDTGTMKVQADGMWQKPDIFAAEVK